MLIADDILQVRSFGVCCYVLRDVKGLLLIDGGFLGGKTSLEKALRKAGWDKEPIFGIVVTHGHLDHIINIKAVAEARKAWVAAPLLDELHYEGRPRYRGLARVTGVLEHLGRMVFGYRSFQPDRFLNDGDVVAVWEGLQVIHLPGHTLGHCGLYCKKRKLLFSADLFASFGRLSHLPPAIFNSSSTENLASVSRALELDLVGVLPNHCDKASPSLHLQRMRGLHGRKVG